MFKAGRLNHLPASNNNRGRRWDMQEVDSAVRDLIERNAAADFRGSVQAEMPK